MTGSDSGQVPPVGIAVAALVSAGFDADWIFDRGLKSLWFWYEQVLALNDLESVVMMDKQTLAIAAALGDKKAGKEKKKQTLRALKHLNKAD